jgi:hypothetical protein
MSDQPETPVEQFTRFIDAALAAARGEPAPPVDDDAPKPKRDLGQGARGDGGRLEPTVELVFAAYINDQLDRPYR